MIVKNKYQMLNRKLREIQIFKVEASKKIVLQSSIDDMINFEIKLLELYNDLLRFISALRSNLKLRLTKQSFLKFTDQNLIDKVG
jgi:hypothetical protein